jgi:hypothetical protein
VWFEVDGTESNNNVGVIFFTNDFPFTFCFSLKTTTTFLFCDHQFEGFCNRAPRRSGDSSGSQIRSAIPDLPFDRPHFFDAEWNINAVLDKKSRKFKTVSTLILISFSNLST